MKRVYIIIVILVTATIAKAQSLQDAADAYSKENYSASVQIYEKMSDSIGVSPELYYNLGNSYYKLKNYPKAILNYERALLLSPGDEDIKFNLELSKAMLTKFFKPSFFAAAISTTLQFNSFSNLVISIFVIFLDISVLLSATTTGMLSSNN